MVSADDAIQVQAEEFISVVRSELPVGFDIASFRGLEEAIGWIAESRTEAAGLTRLIATISPCLDDAQTRIKEALEEAARSPSE